MKSIAERLKEARAKKNLSAKELADTCGISVSAVQMYECGERVPRDDVKKRLAEALEERVQDLFF